MFFNDQALVMDMDYFYGVLSIRKKVITDPETQKQSIFNIQPVPPPQTQQIKQSHLKFKGEDW